MRCAIALVLLFANGAFGRTASLERLSIGGSEYARVGEWGADKGLRMTWNHRDGNIDLTGAGPNLHLTVDSRRAEIGSVMVWLSLPVVNRGGVAFISLIDLHTTIEPVLFPHKTDSRLATICIDPGHGGKDTGKAVGSNYEKKYTLLLAQELEELLKAGGFKVILTRHRDETVELGERAPMASHHGADVFISLHYNAAPERDIRGVIVYCLAPAGFNSSDEGGGRSAWPAEVGNLHDENNVLLAYNMQKSLTRNLSLEDLGMKRSHFKVLRDARVPAILIEGGFMTNPSDAKNIYDGTFRRRMAQAIVDGLLAYRRETARD